MSVFAIDFKQFANSVTQRARYILEQDSRSFLDAVLKTSAERASILRKATKLWRSQLGYENWVPEPIWVEDEIIEQCNVPEPYGWKRMIPRPDRASENRANAKGIPCLYLSTDSDTCIAESRAWIGAFVSVSEFVVCEDKKLVDCTSNDLGARWPHDPERYVWNQSSIHPAKSTGGRRCRLRSHTDSRGSIPIERIRRHSLWKQIRKRTNNCPVRHQVSKAC